MPKIDQESFFKPYELYLTKQTLFSLHNGILQQFALHQNKFCFLHWCIGAGVLPVGNSLKGILTQKSILFEGDNPTEALEAGAIQIRFPYKTVLSFVVEEAAERKPIASHSAANDSSTLRKIAHDHSAKEGWRTHKCICKAPMH